MAKLGKIIYKGTLKSGREIIIRYPKVTDAKAAMIFINKLSKERTFLLVQGEQISLTEEKKWLKSVVKGILENKAVHLMAFSGDALVGGTAITLGRKVYKHRGTLGISIAKEFRGEGLGKLMMQLIIREAKKTLKSLKIIQLNVFAPNKPALSLYKKMGFKTYGKLPGGIAYKGKYVDDILMYKKV